MRELEQVSRLDSFIRRMQAQISCLGQAGDLISGLEGPVFELGLGNGRSFDHLRELFPARDIYVFEMKISAHPSCIPDHEHLFIGDFLQRLPEVVPRFRDRVALVHADCCASGQMERDQAVVVGLQKILAPLVAHGGIIVSDAELALPDTDIIPLPKDVAPGRYFMRRKH